MVTDQRVNRNCLVLQECGYEVRLIGRLKKDSLPLVKRSYDGERMKMWFEQGPQFYLFFNLRLFFKLLFKTSDLLFANDLDTLLPNYLVSKIKRIPLIYDSHEIFCEVPELQQNPSKKRIWESLEKWIVPKLKKCVTVNHSIANYFHEKYQVKFSVVRNIPDDLVLESRKTRVQLGLPEHKKIIILQGSGINVHRGAEELVEAMAYLSDDFLLLIVGGGDVIHVLKQTVQDKKLTEKVRFVGKQSAKELKQYTLNADIGVSIDKDTNLNYHYSLPNKVFDYMHAGIPIIASRLVEIEKLIQQYQIGVFIERHEPQHIATVLKQTLNSTELLQMKQNTKQASEDNNWKKEKEVLKRLILS